VEAIVATFTKIIWLWVLLDLTEFNILKLSATMISYLRTVLPLPQVTATKAGGSRSRDQCVRLGQADGELAQPKLIQHTAWRTGIKGEMEQPWFPMRLRRK
jgi:hypothetical protein